jgi:hypothetical protein
MRTFFLFIACFFIQNAKAQLQGIGKFKIGITLSSIIEDLAKENKVKVKESTDFMETFADASYVTKRTTKILLLKAPQSKSDIADPEYSVAPDVKVYYINYLEISTVPVEKLYLSFYKDTLYKITCNTSLQLRDAMDIKYGKGDLKTDEKEVTCTSRITGDFKEKETTYITTWSSDINNIEAVDYLRNYFNDKCEEKFISYFTISDKAIVKSVNVIVAEINARVKKEEADKKKAELKDF